MKVETPQISVPDERKNLLPPGASAKPSVLIVDDEAGPREALKMILRPFFNLHAVESAAAAQQVLKEHKIDVVTLDLKLPDRNGTDLLQEIKQNQEDVEVIIITGYGSLKSAMDGIRYGAAGYLLKPFNVMELIEVVTHALEKKRRFDGLREILRTFGDMRDTELDAGAAWKNLARSLEAKDPDLIRHSERVCFYSSLLGEHLSLKPQDREALRVGSWLHDMGMVCLDVRILSKSAQLDPRNPELIKCHPAIGARIVHTLPFHPAVSGIIRHHHEQYDGAGYPDGLKGEDIPYLARIMSLADVFDDLTARQPGRDPLSIEDARTFVQRQAGTLFDPVLAELFVKVVG
ncbi:MAG: HD domain-containing phosphohydrolase [Nitrospirota bacterium]